MTPRNTSGGFRGTLKWLRRHAHTKNGEPLRAVIRRLSETLSYQLEVHQAKVFPSTAKKTIRTFTPSEVAKLLGLAEGYLRTVVADLEARENNDFNPASGPGNRRVYTVEDIAKLRKLLDESNKAARAPRRYVQNRGPEEQLQIVAVMNFKGGSGKDDNVSPSCSSWLSRPRD